MGQQKRKRKLTGPNPLPAVHRTKGLNKSRGASQLRPAQPPGGRRQGEGKGANSAPEAAPPTALQAGLQSLTKDLLRFRMVDIRREGHGETQGART